MFFLFFFVIRVLIPSAIIITPVGIRRAKKILHDLNYAPQNGNSSFFNQTISTNKNQKSKVFSKLIA